MKNYITKNLLRSDGNTNSAFIKSTKWQESKEKIEIEKITKDLNIPFRMKLQYVLGELELPKCLYCNAEVKTAVRKRMNKFCSKSCSANYTKDIRLKNETKNINTKINNQSINIKYISIEELFNIYSKKLKGANIVKYCLKNNIYSNVKNLGGSFEEGIKILNGIEDFKYYSKLVRNISEKQPLYLLENIEKRGMVNIEGSYHLDHKIPIKYGFDNNILPYIIADISNLEMIPAIENIKKGTNIITSDLSILN